MEATLTSALNGGLDDERRAVIAYWTGEPLPDGWVAISGKELLDAANYVPPKRKRKGKLAGSNKVESMPDLPQAEPEPSLDLVRGDE